VVDTAANLAAGAGSSVLAAASSVKLSASGQITAAQAAELATIPTLTKAGFTMGVSDTASDIANNEAAVATLANSVLVTASGAVSADQADALAALQTAVPITFAAGAQLTVEDSLAALTNPDNAAGVALAARLIVLDTGANLAAASGDDWGGLSPSYALSADSTVTAGQAAILKGLGAHFLPQGYTLSVDDSASAIAANLAAIQALQTAGTIAQVIDGGDSVADVSANLAALNAAGAVVSVHDSAANVQAGLGSLAELTGLHGILLTNGGTPALSLSVAAVQSGAGVLAKITSPYSITITDTAADIAADLALGSSSAILAHLSVIGSIVPANGQPVSLTLAEALAAGVDDSASSAIARLSGAGLVVTGLTIAQLPQLAALHVQPSAVTVSDSASNIAADLASGSSALLADRGMISSVTVQGGGTVSLSQAAILAQGVDDGPESILAKMTGAPIAVTGVAVSELSTILGLGVPPASVAIADSAANLQTHFSTVIADIGSISAIALTGGPLVLTATQALQAHVDGGAGSLIALLAGHVFDVSGALVSQLSALSALPVAPASIAVSDSSADIAADLASGSSALAASASLIGSITVAGNTLTLTQAQAEAILGNAADDAMIAKLAHGTSVAVTGVSVATLAAIAASGWPGLSVAVSDTPAAIGADLTSGDSLLQSDASEVSSITLSAGGTVTIAQLAAIEGLSNFSAGGNTINVSDTAAALAGGIADMTVLGSTLGLVTITDGNSVSVATAAALAPVATHFAPGVELVASGTASQVAADLAALETVNSAGHLVAVKVLLDSVSDVTQNAAALNALPAIITISDSAANVVAGLAALASVSGLSAITLTDLTTPALVMSLATLGTSAAVLSKIGSAYSITITDTPADIAADIALGAHGLIATHPLISQITSSNGQPLVLTQAEILQSGVNSGASPILSRFTGTLDVTGVTVAGLATVEGGAHAPAAIAVSDGSAAIVADLTSGSSALAAATAVSSVTVTGGTLSLTDSQADTILGNPALDAVMAKLATATVVSVSGVPVADVAALAASGWPHLTLAVSDTAGDIAADLTSGHSVLTQDAADISTVSLSGNATVSVAQLTALLGLGSFSPGGFTLNVSDTGAALAGDVAALGGLGDTLGTITLSDGTTVSASTAALLSPLASHLGNGVALTVAGTAAQVAANLAGLESLNNAGHLLTVAVVNDTVADIVQNAAALNALPASVTITDSAAAVDTGLEGLAGITGLQSISLTDGGTPALTMTLATLGAYAGVLSKITSPYTIDISDTPADLAADLALGADGVLAAHFGQTGLITSSTAQPLVLTQAQVLTSGVNSGANAILGHFAGTLDVTGVDVAHLAAVTGGVKTPSSIAIADSSADIAADLASGSSVLAAEAALIGSIGVTGGTLTLTDAEADTILGSQALDAVMGKLAANTIVVVTGVPVAGVAALAASGWPHVSLAVSDTAGDIAADLASGSSVLTSHAAAISGVALNGNATVNMAQLTALTGAGVATDGFTLSVDDTSSAITGNIGALQALGGALGTMTLSDGTTVSASTAAELAPVATHLGLGVELTVTGTASQVNAHLAALETVQSAGHLGTVEVSGTVASVVPYAAALNALPASVVITDNAADVNAGLAGLAGIAGLQSISLNDGGTPALPMALATLGAYAGVLAKITSPYVIDITDSQADIAADLALGSDGLMASHLSQIGTITTSNGQPLVLSQALLLQSGVNSGASPILGQFSGTLDATGVDVADLATIAAGTHAPAAIAVSDTGADIAADLALGAESVLLGHLSSISSITARDSANVTLTATQALVAGVDDSAHSAIGLLAGANLVVTQARVNQLAGLAALHVAPSSIAVSDTAATLSAALASGNSLLVTELANISSVTVDDGLPIILTESQVLAPHVDDGAGSVLSETSGGGLEVTGVTSAELPEMLELGVAPTAIEMSDTATGLETNFGTVLSTIAADPGLITGITITSGTLSLSAGTALAANVDSGAGSLIALLAGHSFDVTGAQVSQLGALLSLPVAPAAISVTDSSTAIVGALGSDSSLLCSAVAADTISQITVEGGTLTLTDAQADSILADPTLNAVMAKLAPATVVSVTGVPLGDVAAIAASGWSHVTMAVAGSAGAIATDLVSGSSVLLAAEGKIGSVTLTQGGTVDVAQLTAMTALPGFSAGGQTLNVSDFGSTLAADAPTLESLGATLGTITLTDGQTVSVAIATALAPLASHLVAGTSLVVQGSADALQSNLAALLELQSAGKLGTPDAVTNIGAQDAVADSAALNELNVPVTISDTAAHIGTYLPGLAAITGLTGISVSDGAQNPIDVSLSDLSEYTAVLHAIGGTFSLNVTGSSSAVASDLAAGFSYLADEGFPVGTVNVAGGALVLSDVQADAILGDGGHLAVLTGQLAAGTQIVVTGVPLNDLANITGAGLPDLTVDVTDTSANLAAALSDPVSTLAAEAGLIGMITTQGGILSLTDAQADAILGNATLSGLMSALSPATTVTVSGVPVTDLAAIAAAGWPHLSVAIVDSASAIGSDLVSGHSQILANSSLISGVTLNGSGIVSVAELTAMTGLADFSAGGFTLSVSDLGASIAGDASALAALGATLGTITLSDGTTVSAGVAAALAPLDSHLGAGVQLSVADTAADVALNEAALQGLANDGRLAAVTVANDSAADVALHVAALNALSASVTVQDSASAVLAALPELAEVTGLSSITLTGSTVLTMSVATLTSYATTLADISGSFQVDISDTSNHIVADLTGGASALAYTALPLQTISVTGGELTLTDSQADLILGTPALDAVLTTDLAQGTVVSVTGVPLGDVASLAAAGWPNLQLAVTASAGAIAADLTGGASVLAAHESDISSVTLTASGTVNAAQLADIAALPGFSTAGYHLTLSDGAPEIAALAAPVLALAGVVDITDTGSNVAGVLATLQSDFDGSASITLTSPMSISAAQYTANTATLESITNTGDVTVTGSVAQLTPTLIATLAADPKVGSVVVQDNAATVVGDLSALEALGSKLSVSLQDSSLRANLVAPLLAAGVTLNGLPVVDTGTAIAAVVESGNDAAITYMEANGATLSGASVVGAADVLALEGLSGFSTGGYGLTVYDTVSHLTNTAYTSALGDTSLIGAVDLKTAGGAATVTAAQAAALLAIPNFSTNTPAGGSSTLTVSDSAANIAAEHIALADQPLLTAIVVNASATIPYADLTELQALGAVAASGVSLTVTGSPATLLTAIADQTDDESIGASAWALSASGTVTAAQAISIVELANFNPGTYTLTLSSSQSVSLAQANVLGEFAGAIALNGHVLSLSGSVAGLTGLTAAAAGVVSVALDDSFANVAALAINSPLLTGSVEINDTETVTAAAANTFLSLIRSGNGPGIAAGSLSFDSHVKVQDSIADLQTVTTNAAWTAHPGLQTDFQLVAQDSVADLTNAANLSFLEGVTQSTLSGNVTVGAQAAESLAAIAGSIHFSLGGSTLTVQDSVTNLLNTQYAAGLALASSVTLQGSATVDAAQAEALLSMSNFTLSGNTVLTISDTSGDLLGGTLATDISESGLASHIVVQLSDSETLDAPTAEELVSIPGFNDTTHLTISDDPAYLLNPANSAAEEMAVAVTVPGQEYVSANTVERLAEIPHFTPGTGDLVLASDDFANAPTLKAIADMGSGFVTDGNTITLTANVTGLSAAELASVADLGSALVMNAHTISMGADALAVTPTEYAALQSDNLVQNGYALGVLPTGVSVSESGDVLSVSGTAIAGGTIKVYGEDGSLISSNVETNAAFTVTASDVSGGNFAVTETAGRAGNESAPLVVLDAGLVESLVTGLGGSFAGSGAIEVDTGKFVNLYQAGSVPQNLSTAALIYSPTAHTISLDVPEQSPVTLITLGGTTTPQSLEASEIFFKHHG
jgi:hypothetical protein